MNLKYIAAIAAAAVLANFVATARADQLYQSPSWAHVNDASWFTRRGPGTHGTLPYGIYSPFTLTADAIVTGIDLSAVGIQSPDHGFAKPIGVNIWNETATQLLYTETYSQGEYGFLNYNSSAFVSLNFGTDINLAKGSYRIEWLGFGPQAYGGADDLFRDDRPWDGSYPLHHFFSSGAAYQVRSDRVPLIITPEPEAYAMMLAGLGLIGFIARRKRNIV